MSKRRELFLFSVMIALCFVQGTSAFAVGLSEVLDIIKISKDVVITTAKAWNIVDQHVDFSDIPLPLLDKTESKLFGKIAIISTKLDKLGHQMDAIDNFVKDDILKNNSVLGFLNEIRESQNISQTDPQKKVGHMSREYYRTIHHILNRVTDLIDHAKFNIFGTTTIAIVLQNLPNRVRLELRLNDLLDYIDRIDVSYRHFQNYVKDQKDIEQLTLEDFAENVVSHDTNSVSNLVERIHSFVAPNGRGISNTGILELLQKALKATNFYRRYFKRTLDRWRHSAYNIILSNSNLKHQGNCALWLNGISSIKS